jgi:serine/threonine-protein kinase
VKAGVERQAGSPGRLLGGRYELMERIGRGGMGVVYRAIDRRLERAVAVKLLGDQVADDPEAMRRLEREARIAASFASPHIVALFDLGSEDGRPYLVLEHVPGGTLAEWVAGRTPLATATVVEYGRQIADGLAAAHARGLIHRDVTLRNVLVAADGTLKLTDFGITKEAGGTTLTGGGLTVGTPISMAPEQVEGRPVAPATDSYGLGVVLYELATGRPPFTGDTDLAVALQHLQATPQPPRELNPALPAWLEAVILRALAKDPADRYPDGAALGAALAGGPAAARVGAVIAIDATTGVPLASAARTTSLRLRDLALTRRLELGLEPADGAAAAGEPNPRPAAALDPAGRRMARPRPGRWLGPLGMPVGRRLRGARPFAPPIALLLLLLLVSLLALPRAGGGDPAQPTAPPTPAATTPGGAVAPATPTVPTSKPTAAPSPTSAPPTATAVAPTATTLPPTATAEPPPTATAAAPTATLPEPAATVAPPTSTAAPPSPTAAPPTPRPAPSATPAPAPPATGGRAELSAADFAGGYRNPGDSLYADRTGERRPATWIYGGGSDYPAMTARFRLDRPPSGQARLTLVGMDAEHPDRMPIEVTLNDRVIFRGPNPLDDWRWSEATLPVPADALRAGENSLTIRSLSPEANFNRPPFFMLTAARLA